MNRILIYTENYQRGGGNQYLVDFVNSIPSNFSIDLLCNVGGIFAEDLVKIKVPYNICQINIWSHYRVYKYVGSLSNNKFALYLSKIIVHSFNYIFLIFYKFLNSRIIFDKVVDTNYSLVIIFNGGFPGGLSCLDCINVFRSKNTSTWLSVVSVPHNRSFVDFLYPRCLSNIDKLIVNSAVIADNFVVKRSVNSDKIRVLYNCVSFLNSDIIYFKPYTEQRIFTLGYVGRIEQSKGIFYLFDAVFLLAKIYPNINLIMIGVGDDLELAKSYCRKIGIDSIVNFTGFYSGDINSVFRKFDLFVFPSLWEGLPYSILEAMSNGILVLSTNVGGIPEIITDNYNGFLVPPADSNSLFLKIKFILIDYTDHDQVISNSLNTINTKFSMKNFTSEVQNLFNSHYN